jgi:hypothetical protein
VQAINYIYYTQKINEIVLDEDIQTYNKLNVSIHTVTESLGSVLKFCVL